jgi:hypothetical protein
MRRVEIQVLADGESGRSRRGLQEDESIHGIALSVARSIAVGARVRVHRNDWQRFGTVRNCRQDDNGYVIGVQYDDADAAGGQSS